MSAKTVADQLIAQLVEVGVRRIYGIVGDSLNPVVDAVRRSGGAAEGGIDWIHVRHEEAAAFAASAEAQTTGELAVCAGSCGPGNLHLINGLYDANRSGAPVLAIAAQIPSAQIGMGYFQETHPDRLFVECSQYCEMVSTAAQAPRVFASAITHARSAPGVAVVTLPGDVAEEEPAAESPTIPSAGRPTLVPAAADVQAFADAVNDARRIAVFAGAGVRDAREQLLRFADLVGAPMGHTLRGKEWIQYDNPFDVGMTGLLGYGAAHDGMHGADLLVLIGTDFPYDQFLPKDVRTVQIDTAAERIGRRTDVDIAVHGDAAAALDALIPLVRRKEDRTFLEKTLDRHHTLMSKVVGAYTDAAKQRTPIHPEYAASVLDSVLADDAIVTADTGMCNVWAARYVWPNGRRRFLTSALHGSMANALPHAIGAQFADADRQVVSVSGDGGLSMLLGELITVAMYRLPVKIVVFDNSTLGMVKLEMLVDGLPDFGVDVPSVDYAAVAAALGLYSVRVERPEDIESGFRRALEHDGPALVDVVTDPRALSLPPSLTGAQVGGFALAMSKMVMNGGVGEAVAMARSNLRNVPLPSQFDPRGRP